MTSKTEAAIIRGQLKARFNHVASCYEIYTTIHGTGVFKWFKVSAATYQEYLHNFPDIEIMDNVIVADDGGIEDPTVLVIS